MNRAKHEKEIEAAIWLILQRQFNAVLRDPATTQWPAWRAELAQKLQGPLAAVYAAAANRLNRKLATGLTAGDIEQRAAEWATVYALQLAGLVSGTSQDLARAAVVRAEAEGVSRREALGGAFSSARAKGIGVTETTAAITRGEKSIVDEANRELVMRATEEPERARELVVAFWVNRPGRSKTGPCNICIPLHGRPEWEWPLEFRDGPGAHPNCVCELDWRTMPADQVPRVHPNYAA